MSKNFLEQLEIVEINMQVDNRLFIDHTRLLNQIQNSRNK